MFLTRNLPPEVRETSWKHSSSIALERTSFATKRIKNYIKLHIFYVFKTRQYDSDMDERFVFEQNPPLDVICGGKSAPKPEMIEKKPKSVQFPTQIYKLPSQISGSKHWTLRRPPGQFPGRSIALRSVAPRHLDCRLPLLRRVFCHRKNFPGKCLPN